MDRTIIVIAYIIVCLFTAISPLMARGTYDTSDERRAREYFISGTSLQQMDMHAQAILEFEESLRYDSSAVTLTAIARSYIELRKYDRARRFAAMATRMDSSFANAWEVLAEVLVSSGEYDDAVKAYERLRVLAPTPRQLYTLGRLYEPRDAAKAIEVFEILVKDDPDPQVLHHLADLYTRTKDTAGRIRTIERALEIVPGEPEIAADLVRWYVMSGRVADAISLMHAWSASAYPTDHQEHVWTAGMLQLLQDSVVATTHASDVLALIRSIDKPLRHVWRIHAMGGALAIGLGDRTLADMRFAAALETGEGDPDAAIQVALAYFHANEHRVGFDVLARRAPQHLRDPRFPYFMGVACLQLQLDSASIVLFQRTVQIDATFTEAWIQLAMVYDGFDQADSADHAYANALRLDPENHLVNNNYAYSLAARGRDLDQARAMAWRALQQFPSNPAYLDTYAWILHRMGDHEQARSFIERAIVHGGNATHYEHLGDILEALGLLDEAVAAWQHSIELEPDRDQVRSKITKYR